MKLYSIRNTLTQRFNPPFVARDDDDAIETCRKAIISGRDVSLLVELENLDLTFVGEFDVTTAIFNNESLLPILVTRLSDIPLPEHIQNLINKLKEVKE